MQNFALFQAGGGGLSRRGAVTLLLALAVTKPVGAQLYYERYELAPKPGVVNLLVQPMAYPLAFISSAMQRDRVLRSELKQINLSLRVFNFSKGNDIVKAASADSFGMAFLGDMPTVNMSVKFPIAIAGLGKRNFSSVVAREHARIEELKGKKIGYSAGSSSHLVLMRGLKAANLSEKDVQLVALEPSQMVDALESGAVAAFSAWEPTPSIALARSAKNRAIYKGMSTDWVVLPRQWTTAQPQAALILTAAYIRSINWMRHSKANVQTVAAWVLADSSAFTAEPSKLSVNKVMEIVYKDLLDVPGAPSIPSVVDGLPPLVREFDFLKELGAIAPAVKADVLRGAFDYGGLKKVQTDPKGHRLFTFDYDQ
jgi:ABC-type nitrate/sulfonate/bicarbonate transport system substrate-binding protein